MRTLTAIPYKKELLKEINGLPPDKVKEVLDYVYFIKMRGSIDPSQAHFWTERWQKMEMAADEDKKQGSIVGDGSAENLIENLKK